MKKTLGVVFWVAVCVAVVYWVGLKGVSGAVAVSVSADIRDNARDCLPDTRRRW